MAVFMAWFAAVVLAFAAPVVHVVGQQGFLSIDCGLEDKFSGYKDVVDSIFYVSDGTYVDGGENHKVAAEYMSQVGRRNQETVRSFPDGVQHCYALPTEAGSKYLVHLVAVYGNYDGRNSSSLEFELHLGPNYWDTFSIVSGNEVFEAVFVAWASWAPVCLVNTDRGTPFASEVGLRQLPNVLYPTVTAGQFMSMYKRRALGAKASTGYPNDKYDRAWWPANNPQWTNMSSTGTIQPDPSFLVPLAVLQTAVTTFGNETTFTVSWEEHRAYSFMVFLHFADFQNAKTRQFDIYFNGNRWGLSNTSYSPQYLVASCVYSSEWYRASDGKYNITLVPTAASMLPPMLNAVEIYTLIALDSPTTFHADVDAIMAIKFEYGVKKNWMGDPCFPAKYAWDGVKCSNTSGAIMRITSLDLSKSYLRGVISKNFTLLSALKNLNLSYNNLSGSIPDSLPSLPSLQVLDLSGNHLSGNSLCKNYTGSLVIRYDEHMCNQTKSLSRNRAVILITSVVVSVLVLAALFVAYFIRRAKRKPNVSIYDHARNPTIDNAPKSGTSQGDHLQDTENRRFAYRELEKITDNFKQLIGQGGFGLVYYGRLEDGIEVAVKMRSESSSHGLDEFLAEVQSLTKVHHRNVVSLVGYCWEKDHLALVYEYMSKGNLYDHLRGKTAFAESLNWGTRVQIALGAAQGLEYLHNGCIPPIIHRDVKSGNILLGQNLQAKIADLGLSKTYLSDVQTHISATAAGTAGYMDPEYYLTGRLTESSDVYSFGIVLLEAATGEPPMVPGQGHIVQRVKQRICTGDIDSVADPQLSGNYDVSSMWKVIDTAMMCTADAGAARPTMADVVAQLKDSLALEDARESGHSAPVSVAASDSAALMSTFGPLAR